MLLRKWPLHHLDASQLENIKRIAAPIVFHIGYLFDITQIDEALRTCRTREVRDKHQLIHRPRAVAIDHRVFFRVEAATVARLIAVASIRQAGSIAIIADGENLAVIRRRDHRAHFEATTRRA